jgi:hypothetical protein
VLSVRDAAGRGEQRGAARGAGAAADARAARPHAFPAAAAPRPRPEAAHTQTADAGTDNRVTKSVLYGDVIKVENKLEKFDSFTWPYVPLTVRPRLHSIIQDIH